jgi:hypothetical protein
VGVDDGGDSPARRDRLAGVFVWAVIVPLAAFPWWRIAHGEPMSARRWFHMTAFLFTFAVLTVVAVVVGWRSSRRWAAVVVPLALLASGVSAVGAESLHWRWSRGAFDRVARGEVQPCPSGPNGYRAWAAQAPCGEVGWWRVTGVTEHAGTVVVWLGFEDCYAGDGFARPTDPEAGAEGVRTSLERSDIEAEITVTPWWDGWYTVCLRT